MPKMEVRCGSLHGCKQTTKLQCLFCYGCCKHVTLFHTWLYSNFDSEEALKDEATFPSVLPTPILYPLPCSLDRQAQEREVELMPLATEPQHVNLGINWNIYIMHWATLCNMWSCSEMHLHYVSITATRKNVTLLLPSCLLQVCSTSKIAKGSKQLLFFLV